MIGTRPADTMPEPSLSVDSVDGLLKELEKMSPEQAEELLALECTDAYGPLARQYGALLKSCRFPNLQWLDLKGFMYDEGLGAERAASLAALPELVRHLQASHIRACCGSDNL